jgi:D-sedoheptulose 7-phosphate isomerase
MAGTICSHAQAYLDGLAELCGRIDAEAIDTLSGWLYETWESDGQVLVFGNGGSAYTASHFVTDLVKTAWVDGLRMLRAISVVDNYGLTTALGNDIDYSQSFVFPLKAYGRAGDLAIAISGSGNSPNVVEACRWARENGLRVACLTGFGGGKIAGMADLHINVPSDNYGLIEDLHLSINHMISQGLKDRLLHRQG